MVRLGLRQPAQQGAETGTFEYLFGRPQAVARFVGLHQQKPPYVDTGLCEGRRKDLVWRRQQDDGFSGSGQARQ